MGEKAMSDALEIAQQLRIIVARLETGLSLASELTETGRMEPAIAKEHVADFLHEFISPAWAKIDRLHRLQRRCFRLED